MLCNQHQNSFSRDALCQRLGQASTKIRALHNFIPLRFVWQVLIPGIQKGCHQCNVKELRITSVLTVCVLVYLHRKCPTKQVCENSNRKDHTWQKGKTAIMSSIKFPLIFPVTVINLGTNKNLVLGKTKNPTFHYMFSAVYSGYYKLMIHTIK